jgi:hypothetical protein
MFATRGSAMAEIDISFKIAAHSSGREMCGLRGLHPDAWEPISDTVQTTERLADRAFRAREGAEEFVVYFEAYTTWRAEARWNILAKSGLLSEREHLPTRTLIFVLTPRGYQEQQGTFRLAVGEEATQQIWFREICLWRERPEPWWEQVPGLMALLPLCDHGRAEDEAVTLAAQQIRTRVEDMVVRANLLTSLGFFGRLASPHLDAFGLIGRESMSVSSFYQEIMAEGELKMGRENILDLLTNRFGSAAAAEFTEALNRITEPDRLRQLHRTAFKCRDIGGFRRAARRRPA